MRLSMKHPKMTLASSLLMLLMSNGLYAQSYSAGNGQALGTDSVAVGEGSYATATNGVATGKDAVATGEGLDKDGFKQRRQQVEDLERRIGLKRGEVNASENEISITNSLIANINTLISQIEARQATVATLLAEKKRLTDEKTTAEQDKTNLDNALTSANDKYNLVPKDQYGTSLYTQYNGIDNILSKLDWSKFNTQNGRDALAADLRTKIEGDFTDLVGTYTNEQYRELVDGYVTRQATAQTSTNYLRDYFNNNVSQAFKQTSSEHALTRPEFYRSLFEKPEDYDIPKVENLFFNWSLPIVHASSLCDPYGFDPDTECDNSPEAIEKYKTKQKQQVVSALYISLSSANNDSIASYIRKTYGQNSYDMTMLKSPPVTTATANLPVLQYIVTPTQMKRFLVGDTVNKNKFLQLAGQLETFFNSIDDSKKDSWWFDLDDYKAKVQKVIDFNKTMKDFLTFREQLEAELAKPLAQQDSARIEQLTGDILTKKELLTAQIDNQENYFENITFNYKQDIIRKEFEPYKAILEEMYNQTKKYIDTYDADSAIVKGTRDKSYELQNAVRTAQNAVDQKQNEIDDLIRQISQLGLKPEDDTLAARKQEQERLLAQRQQELAQHKQERDSKQAELDRLNNELANSPLKNLGQNAMAEGNGAFASGANAIAYGAEALATGNNAVAVGYKAQAKGENASAFGSNSIASAEKSTALGANAQATAIGATAIGEGAVAQGENSVALGRGSLAKTEREFSVGNADTGLKRKITNVENGLITDTSSEAVTGQQLKSAADILGANVLDNGLLNVEYTVYDNGEEKKVNNVKSAIEILARNRVSGGTKYVAVNSQGVAASARGAESVAVGAGSVAMGANSVAIGSGSLATSDNEFSVGNAQTGLKRRITNVAEGIHDTDAVNVAQLNRLDQKLKKTEKRLSGGIAGAYAAASLVQASAPGDSMISAASGSFNKSLAIAVGYSKVSDNGKLSLKVLGSASSNGDIGTGVGIGYKF